MPLCLVCTSLISTSFFASCWFHFSAYNVRVVCSVAVCSRCVAAFAVLRLASAAWRVSAVVAPKMWESVRVNNIRILVVIIYRYCY